MTSQPPSARVPGSRPDPRRLVAGTKIATLVGSAVGFGAVAGLVLLHPGGSASAANAQGLGAATGQNAPAANVAPSATPQPVATPADTFFSPPPGFSAQPQVANGFGTQGGSSAGSSGFGAQGSGQQGGFGGQMPAMRSGGS